jgi:hypothetical protein
MVVASSHAADIFKRVPRVLRFTDPVGSFVPGVGAFMFPSFNCFAYRLVFKWPAIFPR